MSGHLRRIIDLGSGATLAPGSARDLRYHDNRTFFAETQTSWVRLWVDWPTLQPDPSRPPDDPAGPGAVHLQAVDEQIRVANEDGIAVALQLYRFPLWANGLAALGAQRNTDAEIAFAYPDRIAPAEWARYVAAGRDPTRVNPSRRALEFGVPGEGVGPGTAWARFFELAYARWHRGRAGSGPYVAAFELVNEPTSSSPPPWPTASSAAAPSPSTTSSPAGSWTRWMPPATARVPASPGRITTTPTSSAARRTRRSSACGPCWPDAGAATSRARHRPCS